MDSIIEVKEIKECETVKEANTYLETGEWVLLKVFLDTQLCFQKVIVGPNSFEKIQPFDKIIKIYVVGKITK